MGTLAYLAAIVMGLVGVSAVYGGLNSILFFSHMTGFVGPEETYRGVLYVVAGLFALALAVALWLLGRIDRALRADQRERTHVLSRSPAS